MPCHAPAKSTPPARYGLILVLVAMLAVPALVLVGLRVLLEGTPGGPSAIASAAPVVTAASAAPPPRREEPADRTPEIRGRILGEGGDPAAGAAVRLVSPSPPFAILREAKADGDGAFSFTQVHATKVRVVADQGSAGVVTSAELHPAQGRTLEVTLVLSAAAIVRGVVVGTENKPVAGATLSIEGAPWVVRTATSDEEGAFALSAVPDEARSISAVARGYRTAHVAIPAHDGPGEVTVQVRLVAAAAIDGEVVDETGSPMIARVVACEGQPSEIEVTSHEGDGSFRLPPSAIGCDALALEDAHAPSDAVTVTEGRKLSLHLRAGGAIEGVVMDERGGPVRAFKVGIESFVPARGKGRRSGDARDVDDILGGFRLAKLAPGTYVLAATAQGKALAKSDPVDVAGGATTRGVRILMSSGGAVAGHVYDEKHAPLADAELRFDAMSSVVDSSESAMSDGTGRYRLEGAPAGPFTVRVVKSGYRMRMLSGLRIDPHGTLALDVTLTSVDGGGSFEYGGIGATLRPTRDGIAFADVFPGGPADKVGLKGGDRIVQIDGEDASELSMAEVLQRLRGAASTNVGVTAVRKDTDETVEVIVPRESIVR